MLYTEQKVKQIFLTCCQSVTRPFGGMKIWMQVRVAFVRPTERTTEKERNLTQLNHILKLTGITEGWDIVLQQVGHVFILTLSTSHSSPLG